MDMNAPVPSPVIKPSGSGRRRNPSNSRVNGQRASSNLQFLGWKSFWDRRQRIKRIQRHRRQRVTCGQVLHLIRRVVILAGAILYLVISIQTSGAALKVLHGQLNPFMPFVPYIAPLIGEYIGRTPLHTSRLITKTLQRDTSIRPINTTLYLLNTTHASFQPCTTSRIYSNDYMRLAYAAFVRDTAYNLTALKSLELILPIVDCAFTGLTVGDDSAVRFFYLVQDQNEHMALLTLTMSIQDYKIPDQNQLGPAAMTTMTLLSDFRETAPSATHHMAIALGYPFETFQFQVYQCLATTDQSFWLLESIPPDPEEEAPRRVLTAARTGIYVDAETEQSNIKNTVWALDADPLVAITEWNWEGRPVLRDSWGWVYCLHFFLAVDVMFNLVVLILVIYQNARHGKFWVGDAFVSISATLTLRAALVLVAWIFNGFWTLVEFCLYDANVMSDLQGFFIYEDFVRADLMTIYLGFAGLLGHLTKERVDPALAIFLYELGFSTRRSIARWFPSVLQVTFDFANMDYLLGIAPVSERQAALSPLRLWSIHQLPSRSPAFICASLFPIFSTVVLLILYVIGRKIYRQVFPDQIVIHKVVSYSEDEDSLLAQKRTLTLFEIATGAPLQNRFGLVSDYDNCVFFKGLKYASADGIYCNGFVIANGKFLIATGDWKLILLMKLLRVRFANVYVYELSGSTVQQTARLVYPGTISFYDLLHLNITMLS